MPEAAKRTAGRPKTHENGSMGDSVRVYLKQVSTKEWIKENKGSLSESSFVESLIEAEIRRRERREAKRQACQ